MTSFFLVDSIFSYLSFPFCFVHQPNTGKRTDSGLLHSGKAIVKRHLFDRPNVEGSFTLNFCVNAALTLHTSFGLQLILEPLTWYIRKSISNKICVPVGCMPPASGGGVWYPSMH